MEKTEKYQPANGMEGDLFMQAFCYVCAKHEDGACTILNKALSFGVKEDGYPDEWVYTPPVDGEEPRGCFDTARCTAFLAILPPMTEENPFEVAGEVEAVKEALKDDGSHKCDTCSLEFATCESGSVVFGIDIDPDATGKEADRVISCGSFTPHNLAEVVAFSPSPLDRYSAKFTKELPVPVPDHDLATYAQEMARLHALWVRTKLDAKAFAKSCKEVTDNCEKKELELAEIINEGAELRPVTVFWSYDFTHHVKRLVRSDTREVVEELALEPEDYQTDLPLFDTAEEAEPVEVFKTGTLEGDSGGEGDKTSQIEDLASENINEGIESGDDYPEKNEGDISEGVKTEDLDKGWPDPPERQP